MPVLAAIDVGTNTTRLLVARREGDGLQPLARGSAMTSLGEGLEARGRIGAERLRGVGEVVHRMAEEARALRAERLVVACTAIARDAANADELLGVLREASGEEPRVLSGEEEAALTFRGLVAAGAPDPLLACDLGGGSLEVMGGSGGRLAWATSLPLGARRLSERFQVGDPPALEGAERIVAHVREHLDAIAAEHPADGAVAAGGSAVALARLAQTDRLDQAALREALERVAGAPATVVAEQTGLEPERVRLCFAGACVIEGTRAAFGLSAIQASDAGVREGLLLE